MWFPNPSCAVAFSRQHDNATDTEHATGDATAAAKSIPKAASLQELRAQLRAQLIRNQIAERETEVPAELRKPETATAPAERGTLAVGGITREAEARRQRVLAMLAERPEIRYALITDDRADREAVILALAPRGVMLDGSTVTCELHIPRAKYDPFLLFDLIERHGGTVH